MAQHTVPHFHNSDGLEKIEIGAKEFKCVGAQPPFDHPHVYLDMGDEDDLVCPYCSTHYVYDGSLAEGTARPASALFEIESA